MRGAAVERAPRRRRRRALIEALTYRLGDHTTADDARRYRDDSRGEARWKRRADRRACAPSWSTADAWGKADEEQAAGGVRRGRSTRRSRPTSQRQPQPATAMFDHLFADLPAGARGQRRALAAPAAESGR